MELTGVIYNIGEINNISATFVKRAFILYVENEKNKDWSDYVTLELQQSNVDEMEKYKKYDKIKCHINLRGRKWTNNEGIEVYFNTIVVWKIELITASKREPKPEKEAAPEAVDLPF
jgi:hypothetical protein